MSNDIKGIAPQGMLFLLGTGDPVTPYCRTADETYSLQSKLLSGCNNKNQCIGEGSGSRVCHDFP
jgi:hypothetical protein